jgi:hypothetical protein
MRTTAAAITSHKVGPGYYKVETPKGTFTVEAHQYLVGEDGGYGRSITWFVTWPDCRTADATFATKHEALAAINAEIAQATADIEVESPRTYHSDRLGRVTIPEE